MASTNWTSNVELGIDEAGATFETSGEKRYHRVWKSSSLQTLKEKLQILNILSKQRRLEKHLS